MFGRFRAASSAGSAVVAAGAWRPITRGVSYYDRTVTSWAERDITPLVLSKLLTVPDEGEVGLVDNCRFVHEQVAVGLARRIVKIHELPYIVGINPHMQIVYTMYVDAFTKLVKLKPPKTIEQQNKMTEDIFYDLLIGTRTLLPTIAKASKEISTFMDRQELTTFVDTLMQGRISRRLLVENHVHLNGLAHGGSMPGALGHWSGKEQETSQGIIQEDCDMTGIVRKTFEKTKTICLHTYGCAPELVLTGPECKTFAYVPSHIQYMLLELFKNAVRATVEQQRREHGDKIGIEIPPIEVSLYRGQNDVTIKVRDKGGGIPRRMHDRVFDYAYTTIKKEPTSYDSVNSEETKWANEDIGARPIAGEGFGLPMVRIYSKYFGGDLSFQSLEGHGTDVYLRLAHLEPDLGIGNPYFDLMSGAHKHSSQFTY